MLSCGVPASDALQQAQMPQIPPNMLPISVSLLRLLRMKQHKSLRRCAILLTSAGARGSGASSARTQAPPPKALPVSWPPNSINPRAAACPPRAVVS